MTIIEAIKTRSVCFRTGEPSVVQDFRNPVNAFVYAVAHLAADDWEVDEDRTRMRVEVARLQAERDAVAATLTATAAQLDVVKVEADDLRAKLKAAEAKARL